MAGAKKQLDEVGGEVLKKATIESKYLGMVAGHASLEALVDIGAKINKFGGGGVSGFVKSALFPVFAVKKLLFGDIPTKVYEKGADDVVKTATGDILKRTDLSMPASVLKALGELTTNSKLQNIDGFFNTRFLKKIKHSINEEIKRNDKNIRDTLKDLSKKAGNEAYNQALIKTNGNKLAAEEAKKVEIAAFMAREGDGILSNLDDLAIKFEETTKRFIVLLDYDAERGIRQLTDAGYFAEAIFGMASEEIMGANIKLNGVISVMVDGTQIFDKAVSEASKSIYGKVFGAKFYIDRVTPGLESPSFGDHVKYLVKMIFKAPWKIAIGPLLRGMAAGLSKVFREQSAP